MEGWVHQKLQRRVQWASAWLPGRRREMRKAAERLGAPKGAGRLWIALSAGSDCVVACVVNPLLDGLCIALGEIHRFNLHTGLGCTEEFSQFTPPEGEPFELVDVEAEVSVLGRAGAEPLALDGDSLAAQFSREHLGHVVAVNESCLLLHEGHRVVLRVASCNTLEVQEREERVGYHCFRGMVTPDTRLYLTSAAEAGPAARVAGSLPGAASGGSGDAAGTSVEPASSAASGGAPQSMLAQRGRVALLNARLGPPPGGLQSRVRVQTNDGEEFPVSRKLLRPCIALTRAVRSQQTSPVVGVDVSTSAFDRVLLFLEAQALGRQPPTFGIHLIEELADAARKLGLRPLEEYCAERLGAAEARLRWYSFAEVQELNSQPDGCFLIIDGMVLDVGRWLPEHPGGSRIIPAQALNLDSARMFEVYHASRESFHFIRQFYVGELLPEDRELLPPVEVPPSREFLEQLRQFTPFRLPQEHVCKNL